MIGWMFFLYQQLDIDALDNQLHNQPEARTLVGTAAITMCISAIIYGEFSVRTNLNEKRRLPHVFFFSSKYTHLVWHIPGFAGHLLVAGANIQYAPSNGSISNMVLVGRHRIAGTLVFPSFLFDRIIGGVARLRIHYSEGEKGKTRSILQLGTELSSFGRIPGTAAGRQRFK